MLIVGSRPGSLFLVAGIWLALVPARPAAQAPDKAPAEFDVRLPADAELEVEGIKVRATGEVRLFQSPPLAFGDFYAYALKATWHGKMVTREIKILAGRRSTIDLRDVFQAAAPAQSIALQVPNNLTVSAGHWTRLRVGVSRTNYNGAVKLRLDGLPKGVAAGEATVAPGHDAASVDLAVSPEAAPAIGEVVVTGTGAEVVARAPLRLTLVKPVSPAVPPRIETKAPPKAPAVAKRLASPRKKAARPAPRPIAAPEIIPELRLVPAELMLVPGETQLVHVQIRVKEGGTFDGAPKITFEGVPGVLDFAGWGSSMAPDRKSYRKEYAVRAVGGAAEGKTIVRIAAATGKRTAAGTLSIAIKKASPAPVAVINPGPELQVTVTPVEATLAAGETRHVIVRVQPLGAPALADTPTMEVQAAPGGPLKLAAWRSQLAADRSFYWKEYAVGAAAGSVAGHHQLRIVVKSGSRQAVATLTATIAEPDTEVSPGP